MAVSECPVIISLTAGTTLSSTALYKLAYLDSEGHVCGAYATTGPAAAPIGVFYGYTQTTSTESEAVPVAIAGVVKLKLCTDSTLNPGDFIAASTKGYGTEAGIEDAGLHIVARLLEDPTTGDNPIGKVLWGVHLIPASTANLYQGVASSNNT